MGIHDARQLGIGHVPVLFPVSTPADIISSIQFSTLESRLAGGSCKMNKNPENVSLFGGLAGATLGVDEFEVCEGLVLRQTYAHLMSPYILAFRRPEAAGQHHPGPWKTTRGGTWLDIEIEVALQEGARPTEFDRLNTLWWLLALLRLATGSRLRMPVVSDTSFSGIADSSIEPTLWPVETLPQQFHTVPDPPEVIEEKHLLWLRQAFVPGSELMKDQAFGRAFQTFDNVIWSHSTGSAIVMTWAAMETLIKPGHLDITKRLASSLAALLEAAGPERERLYQRLASLYKARGNSAHASRSPEAQQLLESFEVSRQAFIVCIDKRKLPDVETLHKMWRLKK